MKQSPFTVAQLAKQQVWRWLLAVLIVTVPMYCFVLLYYVSTADYQKPIQHVMIASQLRLETIFVTFLLPSIIAVWVMGFRGRALVVMSLLVYGLASLLPSGVANQLLPGSYIRLALVLVILALLYQLARYFYQRHYADFIEQPYTTGSLVIIVSTIVVGGILLLPVTI